MASPTIDIAAAAELAELANVELVDVADLTDCVEIARGSSTRENKRENPQVLVNYLLDHKHWSPFEFAHMALKITTSRAIAAQLIRHRSFVFQELSQRYADLSTRQSPLFQPVELRRQASKNRQSSAGLIDDPALDSEVASLLEHSRQVYELLLSRGVARECARNVLPLATSTVVYMCGSVRSWIHYIQVRGAPDTQKEHRAIAIAARLELLKRFPLLAGRLPLPAAV